MKILFECATLIFVEEEKMVIRPNTMEIPDRTPHEQSTCITMN